MGSAHIAQRDAMRKSITLILVCIALIAALATALETLTPLDTHIVQLIVSLRTPALTTFFIWITQLGSAPVAAGIAFLSGAPLMVRRTYWIYAAGYATAVGGTTISAYVIKALIDRARPDSTLSVIIETSNSFPSYHAAIAVALYGFLTYLLAARYPHKRPYIFGIFFLIVSLIGFSRVYLGVHFPSDVIAGYALGGIWLILGIAATRTLTTRLSPPTHP